jgi:hypothetical protein
VATVVASTAGGASRSPQLVQNAAADGTVAPQLGHEVVSLTRTAFLA